MVNDHILYLIIKRLIDIVGSGPGLIITSPIMLILALLIELEYSKGPILFSRLRNGEYPSTFKMYKFRSMYVDAEERLHELPVIVSDIESSSTYLNSSGVISFESENHQDLGNKIIDVLNLSQSEKELKGKENQSFIIRNLNNDDWAIKVTEIYKKLIKI